MLKNRPAVLIAFRNIQIVIFEMGVSRFSQRYVILCDFFSKYFDLPDYFYEP